MGSFRLSAGRLHHHKHFNFAESLEETVWPSLRHSCRSELTRQGISLPQDRYSYGRRLPGLRSGASPTITCFFLLRCSSSKNAHLLTVNSAFSSSLRLD